MLTLAPAEHDLTAWRWVYALVMVAQAKQILLRAAKDPLRAASARETLKHNLIGTNSGNLIFSTAAAKILTTERSSVLYDVFNPGPEDAARINEQYDHFVAPLANAFRPDFISHLDRLAACIEQLTIPVTIFGVGAQAASEQATDQVAPLAASITRFCRAVLRRSPSIGVRGEFTANILRSLGFSDQEVRVIGCPSMFLTEGVMALPDFGPALHRNDHIAISLSTEVQGVQGLAERHRLTFPELTYIAQDARDLRLFIDHEFKITAAERERAPIGPTHPLFNPRQARLYLDPYPWIDFMKTQVFSFGTRIHGNIAALLAGTPATVIAHDSRTLELARYFEIPHVDMSAGQDVSNLRVEDLAAAADFRALKSGHALRRSVMHRFLDQHGLAHSLNTAPAGLAFDARMGAVPLPPALHAASRGRAIARLVSRTIRERLGR